MRNFFSLRFSHASRSALRLAVAAALTLNALSSAAAQAGPADQSVAPPADQGAAPPALVEVPTDAAPPPLPPLPSNVPPNVQELTRQLLELEARDHLLELEQSKIRLRGVRIGKYITWLTTAILLSSALSSYGRAEQVEEALRDGRDDKLYDVNGNGKVTRADENRARAVARGLAIGSLVPIGLGTWLTIMHHKRVRQQRTLEFAREDVALKRRSLIQRLSTEVGVAPSGAALNVKLTY